MGIKKHREITVENTQSEKVTLRTRTGFIRVQFFENSIQVVAEEAIYVKPKASNSLILSTSMEEN